MSPAETNLLLEEGLKEFEFNQEKDQILHAELVTVILNSPHQELKEKKYLWKTEDFLPDKHRQKNVVKSTVQGYMCAWEQHFAGTT